MNFRTAKSAAPRILKFAIIWACQAVTLEIPSAAAGKLFLRRDDKLSEGWLIRGWDVI
jgi:hypothetical protein